MEVQVRMFEAFLNDESGAITVDWVVLTAAVIGLCITIVTSVAGGMGTLADNVSTNMAAGEVGTLDGLETAANGG